MANDPNMLNLPMVPVGASGVTGLEPTSPLMDLIRAYQKNISPEPYAQPLMYDWYNMTPEQRVAAGLDPNFPPYAQEADLLSSRPMSIGFPPAVKGGAAILKGTVGKGRAGLGLGRGAVGTPPAGGAPVQQIASRSLGANPGSAVGAIRGSQPLGKMRNLTPSGQTPMPGVTPQSVSVGSNLIDDAVMQAQQAAKKAKDVDKYLGVTEDAAGNLAFRRTQLGKPQTGPGGLKNEVSQATLYPIPATRPERMERGLTKAMEVAKRMGSGSGNMSMLREAVNDPMGKALIGSGATGYGLGKLYSLEPLSQSQPPLPQGGMSVDESLLMSMPREPGVPMSMMPPASAMPGVPASIAGNVTPFRDNDMPAPAASIAAQMPGQTAGVPGGYQVRGGDMLADIATADLIAKGQRPSTADVMRRVQELQKEIGITDPRKLQTFAQSGAPIKSVAANISPAGAYAKRFGTAKATKPAPKPAVQPAKPKFMRQPLLSDFSVEEDRPISKTGAARTGLQSPRDGLFQMMSQAVDQQLPRPAAAPKPVTPEQSQSMRDMGKALGALDLSSDPTPPVGNLTRKEDKTFPATKMGATPKTQSIPTPGFPLKTPASRFTGKNDVPVQALMDEAGIPPVPSPLAFGGGTNVLGGIYAKGGEISNKSNPALWAASKSEALNKMGGKHSARAMQLATSIYQKKGGEYKGKKSSKNRLANWGKQNMEKGGEVMGGVPGVDSVPILAQQGEYVIPKPIVDSIKTGMPMPTDNVEMMGEMRQMLSNWNPTTEEGKKYHKEVEMLLAKKSSNFPMMKYGGKVMNMPQMMYGGAVKKKTKMTGY